MYLLVSGVRTATQCVSPNFNSHLLGRVADGELAVYRHHDGRFQEMRVYSEAPQYNPRLSRYKFEWIDCQED